MNIDKTKLTYLFTSGINSDITLIFDDGEHQESIKGHKIILFIFFSDYFHKFFEQNTITISVHDAHVAYDCVANYFYGIDVNKGNLKPSEHLTKSIQCYNFFGIPFNPDLNKDVKFKDIKFKDIEFTTKEFDALLDVVNKSGYNEKYYHIIEKYFPDDYYFANSKSEVYYDILKYEFNKHIVAIINFRVGLSLSNKGKIVNMEGNKLPILINGDQVCNQTKKIMYSFSTGIFYVTTEQEQCIFWKEINTTTLIDWNETFFDSLEKFNQSNNCESCFVINGVVFKWYDDILSKFIIKGWHVKDVYHDGNILVCAKENNEYTVVIDRETRQVIEKYHDIANCHFVSKDIVAYTRETLIELWDFRKNECRVLGCHDSKIMCMNVVNDDLLVSCDSGLIVKIWDVKSSRMLYCSKKLYTNNSKCQVVGFLTSKFLDRIMMKCPESTEVAVKV